jgi:hypothetical protein
MGMNSRSQATQTRTARAPAPAGARVARRGVLLLAAAAIAPLAGGPPSLRLTGTPTPSAVVAAGWSELQPATAPLPRDSAAIAYDAATQTVVVSSGETGCAGIDREVYTDTWTWNGSRWVQVSTDAPPAFGVPNAYDGATGTVDVLWFPGCADSPEMSEWNGQSWTGTQTPDTQGEPDTDGAMAYDASTQSLVLWSPTAGDDLSPAPSSPDSSTWRWNGSTWAPLSPAISPPPSIGDSQDVQMVYDQATGRILLYGDHTQAMWSWDGTNWTQLATGGGPSPRVGSSMVYDPALNETLLFGGNAVSDFEPAQANNGRAGYTLGAPLNDLWAWNGSSWQQLHPATSPPARFFSQMAYDPASGQVVLFGGAVNDIADVADTWVYGPAS